MNQPTNWTPLEALEQSQGALPDRSFATKCGIDPDFITRLDDVIRAAKEGMAGDKVMLDTLHQVWTVLPQAWEGHGILSPELMAGIVQTIAGLQAELNKSFEFTAENGVPFVARLTLKGDRYGLKDSLVHDKDEPLVGFYDARYPDTQYGQFVSRYYLNTLTRHHQSSGIRLDGRVKAWEIDANNMNRVITWAAALVEETSERMRTENNQVGVASVQHHSMGM